MTFEVEAGGEPTVMEKDGSTVDAGWFPTHVVESMPTVPLVERLSELRQW